MDLLLPSIMADHLSTDETGLPMRRTPTTTDTTTITAATGAAPEDFDRAYRELVDAWTAYEDLRGNAEQVPTLLAAADRLDMARLRMAAHV